MTLQECDSMTTVIYEVRGQIVHIRLDRPKALNAFDTAMFADYNAAIERFRDDDGVRVAIVSGNGSRAFSAGVDLKDIGRSLGEDGPRAPKMIDMASPGYLDKPIIAAIRGYCIGEGLHVALACDFRVCSSDSIFWVPEVAVGMPLIRLTSQAVNTIGLPAALELCCLAEKKDAAWALHQRLVHRVVLPGEELAEAERIAARLCQVSFAALRVTKQTAWKALEASYEDVFRFGMTLREAALATGDAKAAATSFTGERLSSGAS
jgi:enoyl-CoA hydratase/carnithine racemase